MIATTTVYLTALIFFAANNGAIINCQNAAAINWRTVVPIHAIPSFFDEYPVLERIFQRHEPMTSFLEGNASTRNQFPHQVGLVLNRTDQLGFCGGSLISDLWILTAAHCLWGAIDGTAFVGAHRIRDAGEGGQLRIAVRDFRVHPGWNGLRLTDDVGLVRLPAAVEISANVRPIRLSNFRQVPATYTQQQVTISGFGRGIFSPPAFEIKVRSAFLSVISRTTCQVRLPLLPLESSQLCAEPLTGRQCPSDAGGPVTVIEADGRATQMGVVSFVTGTGCSARPAIFTRLNFYLRWIQQVTGIVVDDDFTF